MVKIYACIIEGQNGVYYWKNPAGLDILNGEYVIVENYKGYSLAKVIGIVTCEKENVHRFSNNRYEGMKRILDIVDIKMLLNNYENREIKFTKVELEMNDEI